jgi:hypothetical protein
MLQKVPNTMYPFSYSYKNHITPYLLQTKHVISSLDPTTQKWQLCQI